MKIIVPIKKVIDPTVKVRVNAQQTGVETEFVKMSINPFDEIALEQAIRLKEQGQASEIIAVSCGAEDAQDVLRTALAMGADKAVLVKTPQTLTPLNVAKVLAEFCRRHQPQLVILGKQAIDDDAGQVGPMLAALADWPQATCASSLTITAAAKAQVQQEIDGGFLTVELDLPAVVTADLRLNEPRFITLPKIMKAKRQPIEILAAESLVAELSSAVEVVKLTEPELTKECQFLPDVAALAQTIRQLTK